MSDAGCQENRGFRVRVRLFLTPVEDPACSEAGTLANLKDGRSDAIVYDAPPLMYAAKLDPTINIVERMFAPERYGIVFPNTGGEELKELFDIEIMESQHNGEYQKIYSKLF